MGSEDAPCTEGASSQSIKDRIKREARITCRDRNRTIITTITPPDGFTFGSGGPTTHYPYSVAVKDNVTGHPFFVSEYHNPSDGSVMLGYN